ncbi:hypothetical protein Cni_G15793 [Canna indica]|uniref:Glycosyltransferase n=1 Tax=Canna indica TaxID=4628 RepID=A0AAQ3KEZ0_9LILI|nr:hypothetical protein Cni_G15793 [Canna indica]
MADSSADARPHALFVAGPFQGHFVPAANLAIKLAAKGFIITFVTTEAFHHMRSDSGASSHDQRDIFSAARSKGLDIRYDVVSDGVPVPPDWRSNLEPVFYAHAHLLQAHVEELLRKLLLAAEPPVTLLIADTLFVWPSTLAKKYGLPYVSFWTQPALVFTLYYHMHLLIANGHFGAIPENRKDTITYVPGVQAIAPADLMSHFHKMNTSAVIHQLVVKSFEEVKGADFVLVNTVQELEDETILALQREKPFYAVGPIFPDGFTMEMVKANLWPEHDCSQWLDSMPPSSVLYVSFGSIYPISERDFSEIVRGVLDSKVNFLWVLRPGSVGTGSEDDPLPEGFREASRGRGMVVPWCSQKEVLLHPAVGGFLTHCGWNSILESMWCGVPLLCFPLIVDQPMNRTLVCQNLRIGLKLGDIGKVRRDHVSNAIRGLMGGEVGESVRREMEEVKKATRSALTPSGSSFKNLDQFIVDLLKHLAEKKGGQ